MLLERIHHRARKVAATIALAEGHDPRIVAAAQQAQKTGLCRPLLIGHPDRVAEAATAAGLRLTVPVLNPEDDPTSPELAATLGARLTARGLTDDDVTARARDPLFYADLLVATGRADGAVMGAVATTSDTLRAALRVIGVDPRYRVVTSCFLMILPDDRPLIYADCGVIPAPTAEQLAEIAMQAAEARRLLIEDEPRVALLSFSTHGSARHAALEPVHGAMAILAAGRDAGRVDFAFDGELQADAALVAEIGRRKAPDSPIAGRANVLVFPDLNSGNIAYKLTERLAGARAIGPLLRGLAQPIHDLSRGCSVEDALDTMAITALEAAQRRTR